MRTRKCKSLARLAVWATTLLWVVCAKADPVGAIDAQLALAEQARSSGRVSEARAALDAIDLDAIESGSLRAAYWRERALVQRASGDGQAAQASAQRALDTASESGDEAAMARIANDLGVLAADRGSLEEAQQHFARAQALSRAQPGVSGTVAINQARLALHRSDEPGWRAAIGRARDDLALLPDAAGTGWAWLSLAIVVRDGQKQLDLPAEVRRQAFDDVSRAARIAETTGDQRLSSWSLGTIGGLYEDERRYEQALALSRRAAFLAQAANADDPLYRWQWQAGRVLKAMGDVPAATVNYRQAIVTLERLRPDIANGPGPGYRERAAPVFFDFADMLLRQTATLDDPVAVQANLLEVRATLERVKVAEVRDYFGDQCVAATSDATELERVGGAAGILYPILLPDRTELLLSLPDGMRRFSSPVGSDELTGEIREFRRRIERFDARDDFLASAQRLYGWLIEPMIPDLEAAHVDTLVIVPDGPLRTIPLASLHDGHSFLVERFALATTPGLTLTRPRPLERDNVELLAGGLTQAVQGFTALPNVAAELASVSAEFPGSTLQDESFVIDTLQKRIAEGNQEIVHIATHGQFDSDHTQSFLLAWDDKLTMDRLQSTIAARGRQEEPLELLVLSACQTAAGDDRAALGLAGVALKAGARSALASLWFVNDESTARMVTDFYRFLGDPALSKAEALQQAQLGLIHDRRFSHPSYWAPFLLIGNWL